MIDGRFPCGKDESGAYFVDRNPRFFDIVLDVHRDNKVYPLAPGVTRERVLAELEFYGLQDDAAVPMDSSAEATLLSVGEANHDFRDWQVEQKKIASKMLTEGFARLLLAKAVLVTGPRSTTTLKSSHLGLKSMPSTGGNGVSICADSTELSAEIVKLCAQWNLKATISALRSTTAVSGINFNDASIQLEPAKPAAAGAPNESVDGA